MKVNAECNQTGPGPKKRFCVVFKTNGTRSWNVPDPTTKTPLVISTRPTTTKASATIVQAPSKQRTSQQIRTKEVAAKTSPTTTRMTNISTESTATTSSQTEPVSAEVTTAEPSTHFKPGNNHKLNGNEEREHHTMMIAFIAGGAAVICVAVILLCIWLIISQRRKNRCPASYVAGTTVVANPTTGSQNHFPMPGLLKNPVFDDSVYAELEDNTKKSTVGLLGQASYEIPQDILVKNPGADDIRMKPMNTRSRKILREHPHDSTEQLSRGKLQDKEKPVYHNPEYLLNGENPACQGLIKEGARARCNFQSNVDTYQSLDPDRLMYQPLKKSVAPKGEHQIPEYLALLNPNETSSNNSPNPPEYQPPYSTGPPPENLDEQPEYADYADLDELEDIALKEVSEKCSNEDSCYEVPVDNVPREPSNDYALPVGVVFDALEGHDSDSTGCANQGYERHIYAVLEGPDTSP